MAARRSSGPGQSIAPFIIIGAIAGAGYTIYLGYPGLALLWAGALITAIAEPPVVFTGPKVGGYATPAGPQEASAQRRFQQLKDMTWRLAVPNPDWLPGWSPRASWLAGIAAGVLATLAPVTQEMFAEYWWAPPLLVTILIWQLTGSARRFNTPDDPHPGIKIGKLKEAGPIAWIGALAGTGLGVYTAGRVLSIEQVASAVVMPLPDSAYLVAAGVLGAIAGALPRWRTVSLSAWRELVDTRSMWATRWEPMFKASESKPYLIGHRQVGRLTVDSFSAPPEVGAQGVINLGPKFTTAIGSGVEAEVLNVPALDASGQPLPGTAHPLNFEVITFPAGQMPDIADLATTQEEAEYLISFALAKAITKFGQGGARMNLVECQPMHRLPEPESTPGLLAKLRSLLHRAPKAEAAGQGDDPEQPPDFQGEDQSPAQDLEDEQQDAAPEPAGRAAWMARYQGVAGSAVWIRSSYKDHMAELLGVDVLAEERRFDAVFAGALLDGTCDFTDPDMPTTLQRLAMEDEWNFRWGAVLKQDANPPEPAFDVYRSERIGQVQIQHQPFLTKQGLEPGEYQKLEGKLSTTLQAAPFVSVVGYPAQRGRPGDRHPQAFAVRWADGPVPTSPDRIAPTEKTRSNASTSSTPQHWLLAGQVNAAFDHARLPRPEVISARPLTANRSRGHIWRIEIRLHGGTTMAHLRGSLAKITTSMGAPWLRVTTGRDPQTAVIVAGADFRNVSLAKPADEEYLIDLEWQQAFADSGVTGVGGMLPQMIGADTMPKNQAVQVLDFSLPSGVGAAQVTDSKVLSKLKGASDNSFIQVLPGIKGASSIRMLASAEDPMPSSAPVDFDAVDTSTAIPFATGVDGEYIEFDWRTDPHLMVVGGTGSGKSVLLQILLYGVVAAGASLYIADPSKGGADFKFLTPWTTAFADTVPDTSVMLDAAYAEVVRRKNLNASHGVGSYRELPEGIRPPHAVVVLDEFTSLIARDKARKPDTDDPEVLRDYEENLAKNAAIDNIGSKVGRIAREARSAGFTLILATQRLSAKVLEDLPSSSDLRTNLSRLILGKSTFGERQSALKDPMSAPDLGDVVPPGRGLFESSGKATGIVQGWFIPDTQQVLGTELTQRRQGLDASEKLDLAAMRPAAREVEVAGEIIGPATPADATPVVRDVGELSFDLGDLDAFMDEDDAEGSTELDEWLATANTVAPEPAPEPELDWSIAADAVAEEVATSGAPQAAPHAAAAAVAAEPEPKDPTVVLLLDVDGVLVATGAGHDREWGQVETVSSPTRGEVACPAELLWAISSGPWTTCWLSDWHQEAPQVFGGMIHAEALGDEGAGDLGGWQLTAIQAYLAANPQVRKVVWASPVAGQEVSMGLTAADIASDVAASAAVELTALVPATGSLSADEAQRIWTILAMDEDDEQDEVADEAEAVQVRQPEPEPVLIPPRSAPVPDEDDPFAPAPTLRLPDPFEE